MHFVQSIIILFVSVILADKGNSLVMLLTVSHHNQQLLIFSIFIWLHFTLEICLRSCGCIACVVVTRGVVCQCSILSFLELVASAHSFNLSSAFIVP